ncbi:hypothetical protein SESBI_06340 [Sesbania bispinosa]|nr:hypothetical protein SESBI_06340 [Sesbania bispinosa]
MESPPCETPVGGATRAVEDEERMPSWEKRLFTRLANVEANTSMIWASINKPSSSKAPFSCPPRVVVLKDDISDEDDFGKDEANIILDISSQEEEVTKRVSMRKKKLPVKYSKKDSLNEKTVRSSKVRGGGVASGVGKTISPPLRRRGSKSTSSKPSRPLGATEKNLFKTPPTAGKPVEMENLTTTGTKTLGSIHTFHLVYVDFGRKLPKNLKTRFFPSIDLGLTSEETPVAIYVFATDVNFNEVIYKNKETSATVRLFDCLCPRRKVDEEILKLMAMKITWRQRHVNVQTVWAFPPDFAVSEIALLK